MASRIYSGTVVVSIDEFWDWLKSLNVAPNSKDKVDFKPPKFNMNENTIEVEFQASTPDIEIIGNASNNTKKIIQKNQDNDPPASDD